MGKLETLTMTQHLLNIVIILMTVASLTHGWCRVAPDFGSGSHKSEIRPFFPNPSKSGSGQICSRIWQLQCVLLITDIN